jgi:hypothetical protein
MLGKAGYQGCFLAPISTCYIKWHITSTQIQAASMLWPTVLLHSLFDTSYFPVLPKPLSKMSQSAKVDDAALAHVGAWSVAEDSLELIHGPKTKGE